MDTKGYIGIEIVEGILAKFKADVLVNSTNRSLNLQNGGLSKTLLNVAGPDLQKECFEKHRHGVCLGEVVVTKGYRLNCKYVYHGALPAWDTMEEVVPKEVLELFVTTCLNLANEAKMTTIAFPSLGCGFLDFPPYVSAEIIGHCLASFQSSYPKSTLATVFIVIYTEGGDWKHIKQAFTKEFMTEKSVSKRTLNDVLGATSKRPKPLETLKISFSQTCIKQRALNSCTNTNVCGHPCGGSKDEITCPPCLQKGCVGENMQSGEDNCIICYTDPLSAAPFIVLQCGHIYHLHCVKRVIENKWVGPRITFNFIQCPVCKTEMCHPELDDLLDPILELKYGVDSKAEARVGYNRYDDDDIYDYDDSSDSDEDGFNYRMRQRDDEQLMVAQPEIDKMCFYQCFKCKQPYFGGMLECEQQAMETRKFNPKDLLCGSCIDFQGEQSCQIHGDDYIEFKCMYCCSVAAFFCFGTSHFCAECHDMFGNHVDGIDCPVGPGSKALTTKVCPLKIKHPPTGENFSLGCGMCRVKPKDKPKQPTTAINKAKTSRQSKTEQCKGTSFKYTIN